MFAAAFLMPGASIRGVVPRLVGPSFGQLAHLKHRWGVSMAALAMRLNQLELLPDWSYRGICVELSKFGRTREPSGIVERETSAVLAKVFSMLKDTGTTKTDVAKKLDLYTEDLDALIFGLGQLSVHESGRSAPDPDAAARRKTFRVYG